MAKNASANTLKNRFHQVLIMVDMVLKFFGATAIILALLGQIPVEGVALMLIVAWFIIGDTNALGGAPVY